VQNLKQNFALVLGFFCFFMTTPMLVNVAFLTYHYSVLLSLIKVHNVLYAR